MPFKVDVSNTGFVSIVQIGVALSSRQVHIFRCLDKDITETFSVKLEEEISCINCSEGLLAVGLWNMTVITYSIPSFKEVERISLGEDVMARRYVYPFTHIMQSRVYGSSSPTQGDHDFYLDLYLYLQYTRIRL